MNGEEYSSLKKGMRNRMHRDGWPKRRMTKMGDGEPVERMEDERIQGGERRGKVEDVAEGRRE